MEDDFVHQTQGIFWKAEHHRPLVHTLCPCWPQIEGCMFANFTKQESHRLAADFYEASSIEICPSESTPRRWSLYTYTYMYMYICICIFIFIYLIFRLKAQTQNAPLHASIEAGLAASHAEFVARGLQCVASQLGVFGIESPFLCRSLLPPAPATLM